MAVTATPTVPAIKHGISKNTVAVNDFVLGKNLRGGATTLLAVSMDNTVAGASANWLKIFDSDGGTDSEAADLTAGTSKPQIVFPIAADGTPNIIIPNGLKFSAGVTYFVSKEAGNVATAAPDQNQQVIFITTS